LSTKDKVEDGICISKNCTELYPNCGSCKISDRSQCASCLNDWEKLYEGICVKKTCLDIYKNCDSCDKTNVTNCATCKRTRDKVDQNG